MILRRILVLIFLYIITDLVRANNENIPFFDPRLNPLLETNPASSKNPGFKVQVTKSGLDYVKEFSVRLLSQELPNIPLPPEIKRDVGGNRGFIRIIRPTIADFRPPKYYDLELTPPNKIKWLMRAIQIRMTGGFDGAINTLIPVQMRGLFEARINDMSFDLVAELFSAPTGQPFVKVDVCHAGVHSMDISISEVGPIQELAFRAFKSTVQARLRPVITTELCRIITEMINVRVNRILLGFPTQIPVTQKIVNLVGTNQNRFNREKGAEGTGSDFGPHIPPTHFGTNNKPSPSSLILDYRLIDPPSTANQSLTTKHMGEISWFGRGKTPFYPHEMPEIELARGPNRRKMLRIYGSDFVGNSLLYHAHHRGIFRFRVNPESIRAFKPLLKTTCPLGGSEEGIEDYDDYGEAEGDEAVEEEEYAEGGVVDLEFPDNGPRSSNGDDDELEGENIFRRRSDILKNTKPVQAFNKDLNKFNEILRKNPELDDSSFLPKLPNESSTKKIVPKVNRKIKTQRQRRRRLSKRQAGFGGFSITHNNEAFLPFCLGDFLDGVEEEFPNEQLELRYKSNAPPTFFFKDNQATIKAHGSLFLSLFPKPKFLFHAFTRAEVAVNITLSDDNRVSGTANVTKLDLKLTRSRISELKQKSLDFISDLTKSIINDLTTDILQEGIPIPTVSGLTLRSPELSMHNHFAALETDFEFDQQFLASLLRSNIDISQLRHKK